MVHRCQENMPMINGITVNIVSALIIFLLGAIFTKKIYPALEKKFNPLVKFLRIKNGNDRNRMCVIHGYARARSQNKNILYIEQGDLHALMHANEILSTTFDKSYISFKDGIVRNNCAMDNDVVLCISGPKWNKCTERYIGELGSPLKFLKTPKCVSVKTSRMDVPVNYVTEMATDGTITTCYGFVVFGQIDNKEKGTKNILICCGRSTHSTNASISILGDIKHRKGIYKELKTRGVINAPGSWGILFKVTKTNSMSTPYEINIVQVFLRDDFIQRYKYEYK